MKAIVPVVLLALVLAGLTFPSWGPDTSRARDDGLAAQEPAAKRRDELIRAHPDVPRDALVGTTPLHHELLDELKRRYRAQLDSLRLEIAAAGAGMVLVFLTPEFESDAQKVLEPFIAGAAAELGIEYVDLSPRLRGLDPAQITQMPRDGHWSARGAEVVAEGLNEILARHAGDRSATVLERAGAPSVFGDLDPRQDVILDGGKGLPYRLQTNRQGLRLDHDLEFPKKRQRVLLLGDSQIYCPFLDNPATIPAQMQRLRPESEIVSAANLAYGLDDQVALFRERARFVEPDLVVVQTGGGDVFDTYFSHRNLFSRSGKTFEPTELEERFERVVMRPAPAR